MTSVLPKTTVKFVQLSGPTTALLASRCVGLPKENYKIKQTVATFEMQPGAVAQLLDEIIKDEIPGSGPSGKNVKLLRELRRRLRDAVGGMDAEHSKVHISVEIPLDPVREELLSQLAAFYWDAAPEGGAATAAMAIDRLAGRVTWESMEEFRDWLSDVL